MSINPVRRSLILNSSYVCPRCLLAGPATVNRHRRRNSSHLPLPMLDNSLAESLAREYEKRKAKKLQNKIVKKSKNSTIVNEGPSSTKSKASLDTSKLTEPSSPLISPRDLSNILTDAVQSAEGGETSVPNWPARRTIGGALTTSNLRRLNRLKQSHRTMRAMLAPTKLDGVLGRIAETISHKSSTAPAPEPHKDSNDEPKELLKRPPKLLIRKQKPGTKDVKSIKLTVRKVLSASKITKPTDDKKIKPPIRRVKVQPKPLESVDHEDNIAAKRNTTAGRSLGRPHDVDEIDSAALVLTPLETEQPPVPTLSYGLERVLFNPGVYHLQDPRSRVYNFDPYLETIMPVSEFDFNALKEYITSSRDVTLEDLAKKNGKRYVGSTSSMTGVLAHFHSLLSQCREINTSMLSKDFPSIHKSFTLIQRAPSAIFLKWQDGVYAIDADKEFATANILSMLGKSMEKLLTLKTDDFERYRKTNSDQITEEERNEPEAYHYSTLGDFLMRSQLDAHDKRLPGTGMFDLKTRAVLTIRMDASRHEEMNGYEIKRLHGEFESFEREYYDMIRAAFLKYSLQVRMGRMDGIFVAYHNTQRIFGFQYIPKEEMDLTIHGQSDTSLGDREFLLSVELLNKVLDKATKKFPQQSLRLHFETRETENPFMYVFAEPVTNEQMAEIQTTRNQEIQDFEKSVLGLEKEMVERDENSWDDVQAIVDDAVHKDEAEEDELDDSLTAPTQEEWVDQYKEEAQDDEVPDELSAEAIEDEVEIEEAEEAEGQSENGEHGGSSVEVEAEEDDSVYPGKNLVGLEPGERELLDTGSGTSFVDGLNPIEFDEEVSSMEPSMEDSEMDEVPEADTAESSPLNAVTEEQVQANPDQSDAPNPAADSVLTALRAKLYGVGDVYGKTDVSPAARNEEESSAKGLDEESTHDADQQSDQIELLEESELATPSTEPITVEDAALEEALLSDLDHEVFDEGHSSGEHLLSAGAEEELLLGQETEGTESTTDLDDTQTPQGAEPQAKIFQPEQSSELPGITLSEALKQKPSPNPPSLTSTSSQFSEKLSNTPEIIGMIVAMRNKVNGQYVKRPTNFNASKKWVVEYRIQEIASQERAQKLYDMCKKRRKKALDPNRFDGDDNKYMRTFFQSLRTLSDNGKKWRARREREERENEDVVLGKDEE